MEIAKTCNLKTSGKKTQTTKWRKASRRKNSPTTWTLFLIYFYISPNIKTNNEAMYVNYYCSNRTFHYSHQKTHIQRNTWNMYRTSADFHLPRNVNSVKKKSLRYLLFWIVSCISLETSSGENAVKVIFSKLHECLH